MHRLSVTLPEEIAESFYAKVTKGDRSKFVSEAIKEALNKEEKLQAYQSLLNFVPFDISEDSVDVLRNIRKSRREVLAKKGK